MEWETIQVDLKDLILTAMRATRDRTGSDVALYVDEAMTRIGPAGVARFLPVIAVEAGGYDPLLPSLPDEVGRFFGALLPVAEIRVEQINQIFGLEPDDVIDLVDRSMTAGRR